MIKLEWLHRGQIESYIKDLHRIHNVQRKWHTLKAIYGKHKNITITTELNDRQITIHRTTNDKIKETIIESLQMLSDTHNKKSKNKIKKLIQWIKQ